MKKTNNSLVDESFVPANQQTSKPANQQTSALLYCRLSDFNTNLTDMGINFSKIAKSLQIIFRVKYSM